MPISQDIVEPDPQPPQRRNHSSREYSNGQDGRTEPFPAPSGYPNSPHEEKPTTAAHGQRPESREELIARIKQDQRPQLFHSPPRVARTASGGNDCPPPPLPARLMGPPPPPFRPEPLLPSPELDQYQQFTAREHAAPNPHNSGTERPRSALHAGDFREQIYTDIEHANQFIDHHENAATWTSTSPTDPWFTPSLPTSRPASVFEGFNNNPFRPVPAQARSRTASQSSLSSSFVYRPPTSPLARGPETNDLEERARSRSPTKSSRRRTFSPRAFRTVQNSPPAFSASMYSGSGLTIAPLRQGATHPFQTHQPRRSISTLGNIPQLSSSHTTPPRSRRRSILADGSPLQAPLVGGYEESILRGRMSTLPSRPLDFVAQIGVLGLGKCKSSLRCPPHLIIPFPAVFYNYGNYTIQGDSASGGPSPYVGMIDLENLNNNSGDQIQPQNGHGPGSPISNGDNQLADSLTISNSNGCNLDLEKPRSHRKPHGSFSKKAPPGGYRIPQRGQLQIVIKNPNKTAVKLFLIPYDLDGMEPGQKTFIRQRSYSAGPIIDMPLSARKNLGTDRPEAALTNSTDPKDRPVLRYLIHIHICCPSRGRFYLYNSIRVVFANRVPDGKEKLRNEIQLPEPRYSSYKLEPDSGEHENSNSDALRAQQHYTSGQDFEAEIGAPMAFSQSLSAKLDQTDHPAASWEQSQTLSFRRKPLPAVSAEGSSNDSRSSQLSSNMQREGLENINRPGSSGSPMDIDSPSFSRESDALRSSDRTTMATGRQSKESSQSPKNGLLSLQLRDLIRKEHPDLDDPM